MLSDEETERVRVVESKYEAGLLRDPAVVGIGVGAADDNPAEGVVVVMVRSGRQRRSIPSRLDGIRTEVILSDRIKPLGECSRGGGKVYDHTQTKSR
jgi:hypothetical protein